MGLIGWYYKGLTPAQYSAKSIFYPDKEATVSGSPLELITGSTTTKGGALSILAKVLSSRSMTRLIASSKFDSSNAGFNVLADWIIEDNNKINKPWQTKVDIKKMPLSERIERGAEILRNGTFGVLDESGFMSLVNHAYDEKLALIENEFIIKELIKFNYDKKTAKAKNDLMFITRRTDSINRIYENVKYQLASFSDVNKYILKSTVKIPQEDLEESKKIIASRYIKLVELQEQAFIRFQTDQPIIQLLDKPYIEYVDRPSKLSGALFYVLISFIFSTLFFIRKPIIEVLNSEISKAIKGGKSEKNTDNKIESIDSVL
jgi:hypothetical protein